jgi:lauroyl/myristoyl acyltransferase
MQPGGGSVSRSPLQAPKPHTAHLAYRLGYSSAIFSIFSRISAWVGRRTSTAVASFLAAAYCATHPDVVRVVAKNLALLGHPGGGPAATRVFRNFAVTLADYFWLANKSQDQAHALADIEGHLPTLSSGAILATGHFGFFEFGALALTHVGIPVSIVTDAEPTPGLSRWRADYRARWGAQTIELGSDAFSSLRAAEAITAGRFAAMLVDRPVGGRSLAIELPGGSIPFSMAPAILSWMTGCPIIPVSVRRTDGGRYAVHTGTPVTADRRLPRDEALATCTREVAAALLCDIQRDPLQWYHFVPLNP